MSQFQLYCDPNESFRRVTDRQKDRDNKVPQERIHRNISLYTDRSDLGFVSINTTDKDLDHVAKFILEQVDLL